jgi:pilus assembly protein CpaC
MHHTKCLLPLLVVLALGLWGGAGARTAAQETGALQRLDVPVGSAQPVQMSDKEFIKSARSENPTVATVTVKLDDPKTVLVKGERAGFTRVTLVDRNNKSETWEVFVGKTGDQLRMEFLSLARRGVPTAVVDVIPSGATVILTGTVAHAADIQVIMEIARGLFAGANIINGMRVGGVQLVQLDVIVAAVNRTKTRTMGVTFLEAGQHHFFNSALDTGNIPGATTLGFASLVQSFISGGANLTAVPSTIFGVMNNKQGFVGFLNCLKTESLVKIFAMPAVTTLSGRPALLVDGGEVPILSSSVAGANVSYKSFGTVITFLPIVLGNGKIHLEVDAQISEPNAALALSVAGSNPASATGFNKRSVRNAMRMEDGQTLAIGGLIQNKVNATTTRVPVLGDLPFIGAAFRTISHSDDEEELLVLVTPRLVDPMSCDQLPKLVPGQETRNPDDFELFLEGILEAPRGQRVVSLRNYVPAYRNSPSSDLFPCYNGTPGSCAPGSPASAVPAAPASTPATLPASMNDPQVAPVSGLEPATGRMTTPVDIQPLDVPVTTITVPTEGSR